MEDEGYDWWRPILSCDWWRLILRCDWWRLKAVIGQEGDQRPDERDRRLGLRGQHAGGGLRLRGEGGTNAMQCGTLY